MEFQSLNLTPLTTGSPFTVEYPKKKYTGPRPTVLLILDGWGIGPSNAGNAIANAKLPNMNKFWLMYPHTQLQANGEAVGLPHGANGNTETGPFNIRTG